MQPAAAISTLSTTAALPVAAGRAWPALAAPMAAAAPLPRLPRATLAKGALLTLTALVLWCAGWVPAAWAQAVAPQPVPVSIVLLARPGLNDANFSRSVVLVTRTPGNDTIGVILNRRLPPGALPLPDELAGHAVYFGGPLAPRGLLGIGPQPASTDGDAAEPDLDTGVSGVIAVLPGLQLVVGSRRVRALATAQVAARVKVFAGYAGWAPQQLESEIARGGWLVQAASDAIVFDPDPDTLWERLVARARAVRVAPDEMPAHGFVPGPVRQRVVLSRVAAGSGARIGALSGRPP